LAANVIDAGTPLQITDVVLLETICVLQRVYKVPREAVIDSVIGFVQRSNIAVAGLDKDLVAASLLLCRPSGHVSPTDALIWAAARGAGSAGTPGLVYSFDERFPGQGIRLQTPL
jgi:predicted nucleic-acid-binding protein